MSRHESVRRQPEALRREVGATGAVLLGLGSIVGTGVFVSMGMAAGTAGPAVILAIALAALPGSFSVLAIPE